MPASATLPEVVIWTDARRAGLVADVVELMEPQVRAIGLGGLRAAEVDELGRRIGAPPSDDLRRLLIDKPAPYVFIASMDGATRDDIALALAQDSIVLALEPVVAAFDDLPAVRGRAVTEATGPAAAPSPTGARVIPIPAFSQSPGWTSAADPLELLRPLRSVGITSIGGEAECSLFARLYDSFRFLRSLAEMPDSVDAALVGPLGDTIPDKPRAITGHLAAFARLPAGAAAVLQVSDRTGPPTRRLTLVGDHGRVRAGDLDYDLTDATGKLLDHREPGNEAAGVSTGYADLIAWQWTRLLQRSAETGAPPAPIDDAEVLACCLACLLSARTGQPESPAKLLALQRKS